MAQDDAKTDEQILFYDNGVGTAKNKFLRMIGGAFGFGFKDSVCDLYKFLARNYDPGDRIYFFGFSRGASTVRACNGFIHICGLAKGKNLPNHELDEQVEEMFEAYKVHEKKPKIAEELKKSERSHGAVDVHFLGIWDTVVALGFPKRTDITGPVSLILNGFFWLFEKGANLVFPHSFYSYKLTENVIHAYQALAIDDERTAFWPFIWNENGRKSNTVEQVWFAGMHSNVGGGYGRSGMAGIALHWMMLKAQKWGLKFEEGAVKKAFDDSHVHGRMYNSRDGFAVFFRYHPREIETLCKGRLEGTIRLHSSVIERMRHRTANYAPGQIPGRFEVVGNDTDTPTQLLNPGKHPEWAKIRDEVDQWVLKRKGLYATMLTFVLAVLFAAFQFRYPFYFVEREGFWGWMAGVLDFFLPDFFDGLINFATCAGGLKQLV